MSRNSESPDIETARDRLDNLLESIRHRNISDSVTNGGGRRSLFSDSYRQEDDENDEEDLESDNEEFSFEEPSTPRYGTRTQGRLSLNQQQRRSSLTRNSMKSSPGKVIAQSYVQTPPTTLKKRRHHAQKKIVFELRQKAFEVQNPSTEHGLYALCRIWVRGKDGKDCQVAGHPIDRSHSASDSEVETRSPARPGGSGGRRGGKTHQRSDGITVTGEEDTPAAILDQHLPLWRQKKRDWCRKRLQEDSDKYGDILRVLREMHAASQSSLLGV